MRSFGFPVIFDATTPFNCLEGRRQIQCQRQFAPVLRVQLWPPGPTAFFLETIHSLNAR